MTPPSKKIKDLSLHLQERVKELTCLYEISKAAQKTDQSLDELIENIVKIIPKGWQYPDELKVFIRIDEQEYGNSKMSALHQKSAIRIDNEMRGEIVVFYTNNSKTSNLFLEEEQQLINQIALELSSILDRFEKRELEKIITLKLRYSDRLNVLGELTAGIAHELNTPLGNILGYAELLKKSESDSVKKSDIQKIITSAINAREIVKKLMYFSCEMPSQFKLVNLNDVIIESTNLLQIQLSENKVQLELILSKQVSPIRLDSIQFSQVLFNLVLNAIAAMPTGGVLKITTNVRKEHVILKIKDHGIGMDKKDLVKIFQPFYTTKPSGTGLGLAVVHGIIQSHRGTIRVDSEKGKGTEFTITLDQNTL